MLWGMFWTFFGVASGIAEGLTVLGVILHAMLPGLVLLTSALIACKWKLTGSLLLIFDGILIAVLYPINFQGMLFTTVVFIWLAMALPPVIAGVLVLLAGKGTHENASHPAVEA